MRFIAEHKDRVEGGLRWGVESICVVLSEQGSPIAPSTYYEAASRPPSKRAVRDTELRVAIGRVHQANYGVYGPRKIWLALNREGIPVARCTVERLMRDLGIQGCRRGRVDAALLRPMPPPYRGGPGVSRRAGAPCTRTTSSWR